MRHLYPSPFRLVVLVLLATLLSACGNGDDAPAATPPTISVADMGATVTQTSVDVTVSLSSASSSTVSVDYATVDGTAVAGSDYIATSGTLSIPPGTVRAGHHHSARGRARHHEHQDLPPAAEQPGECHHRGWHRHRHPAQSG